MGAGVGVCAGVAAGAGGDPGTVGAGGGADVEVGTGVEVAPGVLVDGPGGGTVRGASDVGDRLGVTLNAAVASGLNVGASIAVGTEAGGGVTAETCGVVGVSVGSPAQLIRKTIKAPMRMGQYDSSVGLWHLVMQTPRDNLAVAYS